MKFVLSVLVLVGIAMVCRAQQVTLSNIPAYDQNGIAIQTGQIFLSWPPFLDNSGNRVEGGSTTVAISGGTFSATLTASDNAGYVYHALIMNGSTPSEFQWEIPAAGATTQAAITQPRQPPVPGDVPVFDANGRLVDSGLLPAGAGNGTALPATCTSGSMFLVTGAIMHLYGCNGPNTWYELGGTNAQPIVALSPSDGLTFGIQNPGVSASLPVTMNDTGTSFLTISSISITGADSADFTETNNCGTKLGSGNSCAINVVFTPDSANAGGLITWPETATLNVFGNEQNSPATLTLNGTGQLVNGGLVVTSSQAYALEGQTTTFTANRAVNFTKSANTVGTLTQTSATTASYTAPASIGVQTALGGCPMMPNDSILNTDISALPVNSNSSAWLNSVNSYALVSQPTFFYNTIQGTPTYWTENFYYGAPSGVYPFLSWPNKKIESGYAASHYDGKDHHQLSVLVAPGSSQCTTYETYNDLLTSTGTEDCQGGATNCNSTSGDIFGPANYPLIAGTDAAGLPQYLVLRLDEIKSGIINHPIRMTMAQGFLQDPTHPTLWPAGVGNNNGYGDNTNSLPYGAILRLPSTFSLTGYSPYAQNILRAFMHHGIIVADVGTTAALINGSDIWEDPTVEAAVNEALSGLKLSSFQVIDQSSLMLSRNSYQVSSDNAYVVPVDSVSITGTDSAPVQGSVYSATLGLPLQGVGIGFSQNQVNMLPGAYSYNFAAHSWVTGSSNQGMTWTLISGPGSVTSAGVYTPPATVSAATAVVLQATAVADTNTTKKLFITCYPWNSDGNFRIAEGGNYTNLTDGAGNIWTAQAGLETGILNSFAGDYPNWDWSSYTGNQEENIYQAFSYTYGDDYFHRFIIPNGNYKVRFLMGFAYNGSCNTGVHCGTYSNHGPIQIGAQNQLAAYNSNQGASVGYAYGIPFDFFAPAAVTSNDLFFSFGRYLPDPLTTVSTPVISAVEIISDSSAAHISIDTGMEAWNPLGVSITQPLAVEAGSTAQLYAVGWYMSNSVNWSVSGGGSISSTGLYTAPATKPSTATTVTVTATSTISNAITATATLVIPIT